MPPAHGTSKLIEGDLFSFHLSKVEQQLKAWGTQFRIQDAVCAWSDLLGFGKPLIAAGWRPDAATWQTIADRLQSAYAIHLTYPSLPDSYMLLLNDGVVRTLIAPEDHSFCWPIAWWIRDVVWAHVDATTAERAKALPGTRTIVAGGQRANYSIPSARLDDFACLASKDAPGPTRLAAKTKNPTIASNPDPLQMDTAFSKAYILDDYGSEAGIDGCGLFVMKVSLSSSAVKRQPPPVGSSMLRRCQEDGLFRALRDVNSDPKHPWMMGFLLATEPITVDVAPLKTAVWRVSQIFPFDPNLPGSPIPVPWYPAPKKAKPVVCPSGAPQNSPVFIGR